MPSVLKCRKTGLFHPHDETNIYTGALRPGHVNEAAGLEFKVVDLRPYFGAHTGERRWLIYSFSPGAAQRRRLGRLD